MKTYGLIGKSLSHSHSKLFFEEKFVREGNTDCCYRLFEILSIEQLPSLIASEPTLCGFNVTIPYKRSIIPFLDELSPEAAAIGAVNVVRRVQEVNEVNGVHEVQGVNEVNEVHGGNEVKGVKEVRLKGYNTDAEGFALSLEGVELPGKALVIGAGGAAAAVMHALREMHIPYVQVSRKGGAGQLLLSQVSATDIEGHPFLINCTPVGTLGEPQQLLPLPYEALTSRHYLYDLVYNPDVTPFLQEGLRRGARVQNGLKMLQLQAEAAWRIWNC